MSLSNPIPRGTRQVTPDAVGNGSVATFTVPFKLFDAADLYVATKAVGASGWTKRLLALDYTVALFANSASVTFATALPVGTVLRLKGLRYGQRLTSVVNGGNVRAVPLENDLDAIVVELQEHRRDLDAIQDPALSAEQAHNDRLAAEAARVAADAARALASSEADRASVASGLFSPVLPSTSVIASTSVPAGVASLETRGFAAAGDLGGAFWKKLGSAPGTVKAWHKQSADGAWWQMLATVGAVSGRAFGAVGSGAVNDAPALLLALDAAVALGASYVDVVAGVYRCDARLDMSLHSGVTLRTTPATVLDFSGSSAPWENSTYNGLVYASGSKGSANGIVSKSSAKTRRLSVSSFVVASGLATLQTAVAHGLVTGQYVHVGGQSSSQPAGQQGAFSQPWEPFGAVGDIPFKITVTTPTEFTFATTATSAPASYIVATAGNVLELASGAGTAFAVNDRVLLSTGVALTGGGVTTPDGEINKVKLVSGDLLVLWYDLEVDVDPVNSPVLYKLTMPADLGVIGGGVIRGRGYNTAASTTYGQVGVRFSYCERVNVAMRFERIDQTACEFRSCLDGRMSIDVVFGADDEGGRLTGFEKVQYGGSLANACRNCTIEKSRVWGGRHAFIISLTSAEPGRSWGCRIIDNEAGGTWYAAICAQNSNGSLWVQRNRFNGRAAGINPRAGRTYIYNNEFINVRDALQVWRRPTEIDFSGNKVRGCTGDVVSISDDFITGFWPLLTLADNDVDGCYRFIYLPVLSTLGSVDRSLTIRGNRIRDVQSTPIYLRGGAALVKGVIADNQIYGVGLASPTPTIAIRLENPVDMVVRNNVVEAGAGLLDRGVYIEGSLAATCKVIKTLCTGNSGPDVDITAGVGHRMDAGSQMVQTPANAAGVLAPVALADGRATTLLYTANVSDISNAVDGDEVALMRPSGAAAVVHGAGFRLAGSVNFTPNGANSTLHLRKRGTVWYEVGRAQQ